MKFTTITLKDRDAAFVVREDGSEEVLLPKHKEDGIVEGASLAIMRCASMLHSPELIALVDNEIEKQRAH